MPALLKLPVTELLELLVAVIGSALLTVLGVLTEQASIHNLLTGQPVLGAWEAVMGGVLLFVGVYLLGYQEVWPRVAHVVGTLRSA